MPKKITLNLESIQVSSFATSASHQGVNAAHLATKHTGSPCCQDTVCVTRIECSSNFCTG